MSEVIDKPVNVSAAVDDLFKIRDEIKRLTEIESRIKEVIMTAGASRIEGTFTVAVLKKVQPAPGTDWEALTTYLKVSQDVLDIFAKPKAAYTTITFKPLERKP